MIYIDTSSFIKTVHREEHSGAVSNESEVCFSAITRLEVEMGIEVLMPGVE